MISNAYINGVMNNTTNTDNTPIFDESLRLILVAILGKKNAHCVLELVYKFGEESQELVIFIEELVNAKEKIMDAQEKKMDYLLRRLYRQERERYADPDQCDDET